MLLAVKCVTEKFEDLDHGIRITPIEMVLKFDSKRGQLDVQRISVVAK